ncbi:hypothetical protein FG167_16655 [Lacinutrix sp. WUR7]|uniref:DUF6327 family protein n=1 Tax=Lacinutrix sp. WUR7 TaxID=2653681 RepID=UPI00193D5AF2|nr:DUF6327 family protein [Lacinutrix sp. WUR7]QRM90802.1 hypothetical protein FG167_16655 [Lacinutrix sp. WUR7]
MIPNSYNSFDEIDNQLKILSLQKQIYKQHIKLNLKSSKDSLSATTIKNEVKVALQEQLLTFIMNSLIKKFR